MLHICEIWYMPALFTVNVPPAGATVVVTGFTPQEMLGLNVSGADDGACAKVCDVLYSHVVITDSVINLMYPCEYAGDVPEIVVQVPVEHDH